jgi:hypothetical protein
MRRPTLGMRTSYSYMGGPVTYRYTINGVRVPRRLWAFVANRIRPR